MGREYMREAVASVISRHRAAGPAVAAVLAMSCFFIGLVVFVGLRWEISALDLTCDPATSLGFPFYIGFLSNVGVMLWSAAGGICLLSAGQVLARDRRSQLGQFLLATGILTALVAVDDMFVLHEWVCPKLLGIPERLVLAGYAVLGLLYLAKFRAVILDTEYLLLGFALAGLGYSVVADLLPGNTVLQENSAKFVGVVSWLVYCVRVAGSALTRSGAEASATRS